MNHALIQDLLMDYPGVFEKDADIEIGVGWYTLLQNMCDGLEGLDVQISKVSKNKEGQMAVEARVCNTRMNDLVDRLCSPWLELSTRICDICGTKDCKDCIYASGQLGSLGIVIN